MKKICGILKYVVLIGSLIAGLYVGGYLMFIKPIVTCITAFDLGALTGAMIGWSIVKCIFAGTVSGIIIYLGYIACVLLCHFADM